MACVRFSNVGKLCRGFGKKEGEKGKKEKKENRRRDMYAVAYNAPTKNQALRDSFADFFLIRSSSMLKAMTFQFRSITIIQS